jgi:hypothetical protein
MPAALAAIMALELSHWLLKQNGIVVPIRRLQYVDLSGSKVYSTSRSRPSTISRARKTAAIINTIWPTL